MIDRFGTIRDHFQISKGPPLVLTATPLSRVVLVLLIASLASVMLARRARSRSASTV